jgi:hypothetical protein
LLARQEWDGIAAAMDALLGSSAAEATNADDDDQEQSA